MHTSERCRATEILPRPAFLAGRAVVGPVVARPRCLSLVPEPVDAIGQRIPGHPQRIVVGDDITQVPRISCESDGSTVLCIVAVTAASRAVTSIQIQLGHARLVGILGSKAKPPRVDAYDGWKVRAVKPQQSLHDLGTPGKVEVVEVDEHHNVPHAVMLREALGKDLARLWAQGR